TRTSQLFCVDLLSTMRSGRLAVLTAFWSSVAALSGWTPVDRSGSAQATAAAVVARTTRVSFHIAIPPGRGTLAITNWGQIGITTVGLSAATKRCNSSLTPISASRARALYREAKDSSLRSE